MKCSQQGKGKNKQVTVQLRGREGGMVLFLSLVSYNYPITVNLKQHLLVLVPPRIFGMVLTTQVTQWWLVSRADQPSNPLLRSLTKGYWLEQAWALKGLVIFQECQKFSDRIFYSAVNRLYCEVHLFTNHLIRRFVTSQQTKLREAIPEKNLIVFGHFQNRLDPPPLFSWTPTRHFFF